MIRLVYIAGPFSAPTREGVESNIKQAVDLGVEVAKLGVMPVIPHSNTADPRFEEVQPYQFWIDGTAALLLKCDAVVLTEDWERSKGARGEVVLALDHGIPVFHTVEDLGRWLRAKAGEE